jgi:YD repeat-containing protein
MKRSWIWILSAGALGTAWASALMQGGGGNPFNSGGAVYSSYPGASALKAKTIDNSFYKPEWAPGKFLHDVNMLTGQPAYTVPIAEISAGGAVRFPISLTYSGNVRAMYDADNEKGPTSWIGYGWNFSAPFIAANTRGTADISDDIYYCDLGPWGSGQFLVSPTGRYYLSTNPSVIIDPPVIQNNTITNWVIELPEGLKLSFGSDSPDDNAVRFLNRVGDQLTGSPFTGTSGSKVNYRWDLRRMEDARTLQGTSNSGLFFRYNRFNRPIGSGGVASYTQESYLNDIVSKNWRGDEIEKFVFVLMDKLSSEYATSDFEPDMGQNPNETKFLQRVERYLEGGPLPERRFILNAGISNPVEPAALPQFPYPKRLLRNIQMEVLNPLGAFVSDPQRRWNFTYDKDHHFGLNIVSRPLYGREEFVYTSPDYGQADYGLRTGQDATVRKVRNMSLPGGPTEITLTSNTYDLTANYESMSQCTEKFCFVSFLEKNQPMDIYGPERLHLLVYKNNGNYFKLANDADGALLEMTFISGLNKSLKVIPWNDNFFVVNAAEKTFTLFEWDGEKFIRQTNILKRRDANGSLVPIRVNPTFTEVDPDGERYHKLTIVPGADFFVVQDYGIYDCDGIAQDHYTQVYVVKKINGVWRDVNENSCQIHDLTQCPMHTNDFSRQNVKQCMEFHELPTASANNNLINIIDANLAYGGGTTYTWAESKDNGWFKLLEAEQLSGFIVQSMFYGRDYFGYIEQLLSGFVKIHLKHFDGTAIRNISGVTDFSYSTDVRVTPAPDYFILTDFHLNQVQSQYTPVWFYKKVVTKTNNVPDGFVFQPSGVMNFNTDARAVVPIVKTHPWAFTIDLYDYRNIKNGRPTAPPYQNAGNYYSWLYEVDPSLANTSPNLSFREVGGSFLDAQSRRYYDITFAAADNIIFGKSCQDANGNLCTGATGEVPNINFATAVMTPHLGASQSFISKKKDVFNPWPANATNLYSHFDISPASRLAVMWRLNQTSHKAEYTLLQSMGDGFEAKPYQSSGISKGDVDFVGSFKTYSDITGNGWGHFSEYAFRYVPDSWGLVDAQPEFNSHLHSFIFPASGVITYKGSDNQTNPLAHASETVHHIVDLTDNQLAESDSKKQGLPWSVRLHAVGGTKTSTSMQREISREEYSFYPPHHEPDWPDMLSMILPLQTTTKEWARGGTFHTTIESFHRYVPENNQMAFTKYSSGGIRRLSQTLYQTSGVNQGAVLGKVAFNLPQEPSDADLDAWENPDMIFSTNGADQHMIGATWKEFSSGYPFMTDKEKVWKDADATLTDDELKTGVDPLRSNTGWLDAVHYEAFNRYGQPRSEKAILNENVGLEQRKALFYEGRRSLNVGTIENAYLEDAAVLTAENGNMNMATHDGEDEARWSKADAGYSNQIAHTGRWSIHVVDNYGPTINLKLKGLAEQGYDYVISAWVYSDNSTQPIITAQRFRANNTPLSTFFKGDPADETFKTKRWQRYELRIPAADLRGSENLFATTNSGDYLRVRIGTGSPGVGASRSIYVDDIVCKPSTARYTLRAFDAEGRVTHETNNDNLVTRFDYDIFGNQSTVKDDEYRGMSENAIHYPGEND